MALAGDAELEHPDDMRFSIGRLTFGVAVVGLGIIQLVGGSFLTLWHPIPPGVPDRQMLVYVSAMLLIFAGAALLSRRTAPPGLVVVAVLFMIPSLFWLRRIVDFPQLLGTWSGFAEEFAPVVAAMMCRASLAAPPGPSASRGRIVGRVLFGLCIVAFGLIHFDALTQTAGMVPQWLPLGQRFWAVATGAMFLVFGVAIICGVRARLAALLLAAILWSFALLVWVPRIVTTPGAPIAWGGAAITLVIAGAAWIVADLLRDQTWNWRR